MGPEGAGGPRHAVIRALVKALLITLAAEEAAAWLLGLRSRRAAAVVALMNVMTNPVVAFAAALARKLLPPGPRLALLAGLELGAFAAEALVLHKVLDLPWRRALALSAALNLSSYLMGELIAYLT